MLEINSLTDNKISPYRQRLNSFEYRPDIQFLPEGGNCVPNVLNKIAFKAVDTDGNSLDISGMVIDKNGNTITGFKAPLPWTFAVCSIGFRKHA